MEIIYLASSLIMLSSIVKATFPSYITFLPLGGSVIAEIGIILGAAVVIMTTYGALI